MKGAS